MQSSSSFPVLPPELVKAYLEQLGFFNKTKFLHHPTFEGLTELLKAHLNKYPYEALDISVLRPPQDLSKEALVNRLVRRGRGGYCFILVGAFSYLLSSLGYNVTLHRSLCGSLKDRLDLTWLKNVDPTLKKHCNHVVCIVHDIDNKSFIVDVGLGDGPPEPFELIEHEWTIPDGRRYKLEKINDEVWRWKNHPIAAFEGMDIEIKPLQSLDQKSYNEAFESKHNWYYETREKSPFYKPSIFRERKNDDDCHNNTSTTIIWMVGTIVQQLNNNGTKWIQIAKANNMEEYIIIIEKHFGLQLRKDFSPIEIATLWTVAESV